MIGAVLVATSVLLPASDANAASIALVYHQWSSAGITLSIGHEYNTIGFWQGILISTGGGQSLCLDGNFGTQTKNATIWWQQSLGITADGIVGPQTWNATEYAQSPYGGYRLTSIGNGNYYYYGGLAYETYFKKATWNGIYQWGFRKPAPDRYGTLHNSRRDQDTVTC